MLTPATVIPLGPVNLAVAAALLLVGGAVSVGLRLGLEKRLAVAAVRTVVQLLLIGYVLRWVFAREHVWAIVPLIAVMIAAASHAAVKRSSRRVRGLALLAFGALVASGLLTTITITAFVIGVRPWWEPQYLIPLLGMCLGNALTGISLCVDTVLTTLTDRADVVEMELSLGATRWEAAREPLADAVRRGMVPIINSMSVVGLVSLPGMMTGQILAGQDPYGAVKYQIMVMFMIAAATAGGCILIALLVYRRVFNARHQLRTDRIRRKD
jgi:putative ABC transport system permease protein